MPRSAKSAASPGTAGRPRRPRATVAPGFVTGMLAGLERLGRDPAPLLADAGIDLGNPTLRIEVDRYAALYNRIIAELGDEGFGLFSQPVRPGSFEFLCRSMLGATTLADALERAGRFLHLVLPDLNITIHRRGDMAQLRIVETRPLGPRDDPARVFAFEWLLRLLHSVACWLVGRGLALEAVRFPYARPAHADDYALVYTEHSSFEAPDLEASLRANLLDLPIRRDEAALAVFLDGAPGKISMLYRRDRELVFRVRDLLRDALPAALTVTEAAASLHMSTRTLHRRLEEEGSGFRLIKDAFRRDIALSRLTKTRHSIADIAADLGYADTSAFYRAFVAWTGQAPDRFRRQVQVHTREDAAPFPPDASTH
ncbi:AraC family transcriptional regulator [Denitromonas halophila]|uniref:AraC family transcriptional regulator n=1 Tax=Denitromonas halophila TaxID=1629404 RepID=A0A557R046_9RHOO|nr:AraC family transcriptional regulator [Denitromonas halophila]TVO58533.1 AraC family transcriptional regulator [Denitromonas halophila]